MKPPRLPGTEKFKFSSPDSPFAIERLSMSESPSPPLVFHSRSRSSGKMDISPTSSMVSVNRSESRKRAILPITSKKTCRMLANTDVELNVDYADIADESTRRSLHLMDSVRVPSCPNLERPEAARSLNVSKTSLDTYLRKMSLQNNPIQELPPNFDWKNIRASPSRMSASCSSSCSSEENIWVLRKDT